MEGFNGKNMFDTIAQQSPKAFADFSLWYTEHIKKHIGGHMHVHIGTTHWPLDFTDLSFEMQLGMLGAYMCERLEQEPVESMQRAYTHIAEELPKNFKEIEESL